jgi:hypothetical protein
MAVESLAYEALLSNPIIILITVWDLTWRCVAVWNSTKNNQKVWSIMFVLLQTAGILPILYMLFFQKKRKR